MPHPRVEEVSDSDDAVSDPSEGDIDNFVQSDILMRRDVKPSSSGAAVAASSSARQAPAGAKLHILSPATNPSAMPQMNLASRGISGQPDMSKYGSYQHLYPIYFDARRTRSEGRRVAKSLAVENPLAREIVNACAKLRLDTVFEPAKTHPKDWANPGRVRVALKASTIWGGEKGLKNKHHLFIVVASHLREHPTTEKADSLRARIAGAPPMPAQEKNGEEWPRPHVPKGRKGWKVGELLPAWSPALTGGGVSDTLIQDMVREMQQQAGPGGGGGGGPGGMFPPGMGGMAEMLQGLAGGAGTSGGEDSGAEGIKNRRKGRKKKK